MSCGCLKQSKERLNYDNIKQIAIKMAGQENQEYFLFRHQEGIFGFMAVDDPQASEQTAIEFIHPLMYQEWKSGRT
jgi:hypothetical protein